MDKKEFLAELKRCLKILDENEQRDILDEYTQHIDMKMQSGMSEDEAISDFGDIKQLAGDILEAYHVNPGYEGQKKVSLDKVKKDGVRVCAGVGAFIKGAWRGIVSAFGSLGRQLIKFCETAGQKTRQGLGSWSSWFKTHTKGFSLIRKQKTAKKRGFGGMVLDFLGAAGRGFWSICGYCILALWNMVICLIGGISGLLALMAVFLLGILAVLLIAGYPLVGFVLATLGIVICTTSFTMIIFSFLRSGRRDKYKPEKTESAEGEFVAKREEVLENA